MLENSRDIITLLFIVVFVVETNDSNSEIGWERICKKLGPNGPKLFHSVLVIAESAADNTKKTWLFLSENSNFTCSGVFILEDYMGQHMSTHHECISYSGLKKFHTKLVSGKNAPSRSLVEWEKKWKHSL